ncbi:IMP dehydrogenase/GMP reductase [Caldisphaera lagunensis DSM 15908]|uniref:IMP dehydrogenase/GMP reductase n=1 Tax=Caldisphaera lagunensis (strain DSM 15908 / JCM 11604 / ANMR 0165 / IC-154) TaxID=1056495 RepID=L0AB48_CALLD|nr:IMP dehydrogenase [Caldisphaera lagunensis]AFZ70275.1 IMP dehydrogenase/GMP reductase [Caldisphaera lagunensis DSM 15908]
MSIEEFITFNDVVIVPGRSPIEPSKVNISGKITKNITLTIPVVSSPMDTVTDWKMATTLARLGAIGIIHRNMSKEEQALQVSKVKDQKPYLWEEVQKVDPDSKIEDVLSKEQDNFAVVINKEIKAIILKIGADYSLHSKKIDYLSKLLSMINLTPTLDENNKLRVGAGISPFDLERAKILDKAGADVLVVDVAHLHNDNALSSLAKIAKNVSAEIVAGNLGTIDGVKDTISKVENVSGLRMGISSGSICLTGEVAGASVPTLTATINARKALEELGLFGKIPIIADGGIKNAGDAAKAIIAGANSIMVGRYLACTEESPGIKIRIGDKVYKQYRGMASRGAMEKRYAEDRYSKPSKAIEEGVEGLVEYCGSAINAISEMALGLQASLGYAGARNIEEAWNGRLAKITSMGAKEVGIHDIEV